MLLCSVFIYRLLLVIVIVIGLDTPCSRVRRFCTALTCDVTRRQYPVIDDLVMVTTAAPRHNNTLSVTAAS